MAKIKLKLWDNTECEFETGSPIVMLGANGAGKTRLGAKIESINDTSFSNSRTVSQQLVHRISAQKSLSISDDMILKGLETSEKEVFIGASTEYAYKLAHRFSGHHSSNLLNDYDKVMSLLFAKSSLELETRHRVGSTDGLVTLVQKTENIWNELLPKRKLDLTGNEVHAISNSRYHGKEMSDGERVTLYMIAQALILKPNSVMIIDEPELHIHKAILNKLWDKLEQIRNDCLFIYITHDLDFAVSRNTQEVLWVKSFDGNQTWDTEFLDFSDYDKLPTNLVYEIIGTQKKILFVEGTKSSLDYLLYQELYLNEGYHIVPCGGCQEVIRCVKAKKGYDKFNSIQVHGIVDRDFRTDAEISALISDGIYCLNVAEVENLFIVPELLDIMETQLGCDAGASEKAKEFIKTIFTQQKASQVNEAFIKEMDFQLSNERLTNVDPTVSAISSKITSKFTTEFITSKLEAQVTKFDEVDCNNISELLKVFNYKTLSENIGHCFGVDKNKTHYKSRVLNYLKSNDTTIKNNFINAIKPYLPEIPLS